MSILVTKPGVLNDKDKSTLRRKGIVCVEADDPSSVRLLGEEGPPLAGNDLLWAAMRALSDNGAHTNKHLLFTKLVAEALDEQRKGPTA